MAGASFAAALEKRFSGRPHVGVVTHFEGLDVRAAAARVRGVMERMGLRSVGAIETAQDRRVFSVIAPVPVGDQMELWIIASEQPDVGVKLEARVFHRLEESAVADEYLATFAAELTAQPPDRAEHAEREDHVGNA